MTRLVALAAGVLGCGSPISPIAVDGPDGTGVIGFDVVVDSDRVLVYAKYDDACHTNVDSTVTHFAELGGCAGRGDVGFACDACLRSISVDGVIGTSLAITGFENPFRVMIAATEDSMLRVVGCNQTIDVPLHAQGLPRASQTSMTRPETGVTIAWTQDGGSSALVTIGEQLGSGECHAVGASSYTFAYYGPSVWLLWAKVQPLLAPETSQTALGPVRVWRGQSADVPVVNPTPAR